MSKLYKHLKRGTRYVVLCEARYMGDNPLAEGAALTVHLGTGTDEVEARMFVQWPNRDERLTLIAGLQCQYPIHEGVRLVIYLDSEGRVWARPFDEFHDGRFVELSE